MNLFWKIFIAFMLVIISSSLISAAINFSITKNNSETIIDENIEEIIKFRNKLLEYLQFEKTTEASLYLLNNPNFTNQFLVFDEFGNEILERDDGIYKDFKSRFKQNLALEFEKRNINLSSLIISTDDNSYYIEIYPKIHRNIFFSPTLAGKILRGILLIITSAIACYFITRSLTKRISKLQEATKQINKGNYKALTKFKNNKKDELGALFTDFKQMAKTLESNENSKRQTLSDISHELRSPLSRMKVGLSITEEKFPETLTQTRRMEKEIERMDDLIGQIITIQKLQISKQTINANPITIKELLNLIKTVVADAKYEYQNTDKNIIINNNLDTQNNFTLLVNAEHLVSAFENIIRNAISHTKKNTTVMINILNNKQNIIIKITDFGMGIPKESIKTIFEPFSRLDSSRNRSTGGYGLGLSIAKAVIENHNGSISAFNHYQYDDLQKENTAGLTFEICLPFL